MRFRARHPGLSSGLKASAYNNLIRGSLAWNTVRHICGKTYICNNSYLILRTHCIDNATSKENRRLNPVQFYKCLSDETRLRCLLLIEQEGELCVCELTEALNDTQPKISRHLAQLRKCKLLLDRRQGQWVFYRINTSLPSWAKSVLTLSAEANSAFLYTNQQRLTTMGSRPQRETACC